MGFWVVGVGVAFIAGIWFGCWVDGGFFEGLGAEMGARFWVVDGVASMAGIWLGCWAEVTFFDGSCKITERGVGGWRLIVGCGACDMVGGSSWG